MGKWWVIGAAMAGLAVALGAFGAHGLKDRVEADLLQIYETGARYHMYHAFGLILVAVASKWAPGGATNAAGWCFLAGIILFSGSLYTMTLTGHRWLGAVTPLGGLAFISGWALLAWAGLKSQG